MTVKFINAGTDENFAGAASTLGFWAITTGTLPTSNSTTPHGGHPRSLKFAANAIGRVVTGVATLADAGSRISVYFYCDTLPTGTISIFQLSSNADIPTESLRLTSAGVLQLWKGASTAQIGSNGSTLSAGTWYRLSLAYTITSASVNRFELFVDGVSDISITNASVTTATNRLSIGPSAVDTTYVCRFNDIYIDNSSALTDPGDVWVTAKRPVANGSLNELTTQLGSGGSGYGTGHAPQVNQRTQGLADGWSGSAAGSVKTEEYTIEGQSVGDLDITGSTILEILGWVTAKAGASEAGQIIVGGVSTSISLTTATTCFKKLAASTTYPAGNTDIGIATDTTSTTVSLYECGIVVAYIPSAGGGAPSDPFPILLGGLPPLQLLSF